MQDFEKLGVFYLGKEYDSNSKQLKDDLILYKSKDLTTHAVIIGMTGSGKTGLGIGMIEEAAIDNIPVIAIDPKGDLSNLALTFPNLEPGDFRPWINLHEAASKGMEPDDYAKGQADLWKKGLADWGQDGSRIKKFKESAEIKIYTPGASAAIGVSLLQSFNPPPAEVLKDPDAYRDRILTTATSLLSLIGVTGDPFTSRENILIANIIEQSWNSGRSLGLAELIAAIQSPPMDKVGVMDIESFYPSKDRFALAMQLNNLLASPSFKAWMEGEALNINNFLYDSSGKPRISVFSIAHLTDSQRMFFVTMLLNEIITWMRSQSGTGSLRAMLYMDELFGYLPPTANPPSKTPLLTLLKQARAYGLGLVLATQNPVDLDYKALSNAGTWMIGRLQTERDKERVLAGLEGVASAGKFDKQKIGQILAGLGQRIFYLHSVHENEPTIFNTRWALSYLAGPLTKEQLALLAKKPTTDSGVTNSVLPTPDFDAISRVAAPDVAGEVSTSAAASATGDAAPVLQANFTEETKVSGSPIPVLDPKIQQVYLPVDGRKSNIRYTPYAIGAADVLYSSTKHKLTATKKYIFISSFYDGPVSIDWKDGKQLDIDIKDLETKAMEGATYDELPSAASNVKNYDAWKKQFNQFIRTDLPLNILYSPSLKIVSEVDEDERDFRIRVQHLAHEKRDEEIEKLRKKYSSKINTLSERQRKAKQAVEKQTAMAGQKKMDAAISAGSAILGALVGRKAISASSISKTGTAMKSANRAMQSKEGIAQAQETLRKVEEQLEQLELELQEEIDRISHDFNNLQDKFEDVEIRAQSGNIAINLVGLAWVAN